MSVVNKPTAEILRNILHSEKLKNKELKAKLKAQERAAKEKEPFNTIKGLEVLKKVG